jgi:class 3 adenylate cyclase
METEIHPGQVLDVGPGMQLRLGGEQAVDTPEHPATRKVTDVEPHVTFATVLVGDIRNYTVMVRQAESVALQHSVSRVFELLTAAIEERGGTVKEFPGDAVLAFWEGSFRGEHALAAGRAVLELDRLSQRLASDQSVWTVHGHRLEMDWALSTGSVSIESFGGATPMGLSIVGEPVVKASRLEKFADDRTGRILLCEETHKILSRGAGRRGRQSFEFVDLGERQAKGFDRPDRVYALRPDRPGGGAS